MKGIVFVPGITGSEMLFSGNIIWPPDLGDVLNGYQKLAQLMDPIKVSVGNVIDSVQVLVYCDIIYKTTEEDLQEISNEINGIANSPYCPVPYDWRLDLFAAADKLATTIDHWYAANAGMTEITIVCHSMGGLVGRLLMEWKLAKSPHPPKWFSLIDKLLFICTPHLGAPKALAESLGLETSSTIQGPDLKTFSADPHFPSAYELFPDASRNILYDWKSSKYIRYDDAGVVKAFGLNQANLDAAKKTAGKLDVSKRPKAVKYMFVYGTDQKTDDGVAIYGLSLDKAYPFQWPSSSPDEWGDGVVPAWSVKEVAQSANPKIPTWSGPGDHIGILQTGGFRQELRAYFGLTGMPPQLSADHPVVVISLNKRSYSPSETIEGLIIPDTPTATFSGGYFLSHMDGRRGSMVPITPSQEILYRGGAPTSFVRIRVSAPDTPGAYRLEFEGSHRTTDRTAGWFAVTPGQIAQGPTPPSK